MKNSPDTTIRTVTPELAYLVSDNSVKKWPITLTVPLYYFAILNLDMWYFEEVLIAVGLSSNLNQCMYVCIDYVCVGL